MTNSGSFKVQVPPLPASKVSSDSRLALKTPTNCKTGVDQSSLLVENDRTPISTSNFMMVLLHTLSGLDSIRLLNEIAEKSKVAWNNHNRQPLQELGHIMVCPVLL